MNKHLDDLKPCPFCGSKKVRRHTAKNVSVKTISGGHSCYRGYVECAQCGARTAMLKNPKALAPAWNRREYKEEQKLMELLDDN